MHASFEYKLEEVTLEPACSVARCHSPEDKNMNLLMTNTKHVTPLEEDYRNLIRMSIFLRAIQYCLHVCILNCSHGYPLRSW
jgi:hypothetical protein